VTDLETGTVRECGQVLTVLPSFPQAFSEKPANTVEWETA